jgi:hypothetical protein
VRSWTIPCYPTALQRAIEFENNFRIEKQYLGLSIKLTVNLKVIGDNSSTQVYVNMNNRSIDSSTSMEEESLAHCNAPVLQSSRPGSAKGLTGSATFTFSWDGIDYWTFQALTPSSSDGTRGSGIELPDVRYKGKLVLYRAHVPILNVKYDKGVRDVCGPHYRDW